MFAKRAPSRRLAAMFAFLACATCMTVAPLWAQQIALTNYECIGNSPGCCDASCVSPSQTVPGYSCEERFPIPHKTCEFKYDKTCLQKQVDCCKINIWTGGPCNGNVCDAVILNYTIFSKQPGC